MSVSSSYLRKRYVYDPESGELTSLRLHRPVGWMKNGYLVTRVNGRLYRVHQLIWFMTHGVWPEQIDHIDGNPLNNRLENLRACNAAENAQNRVLASNNRSGCPGVSYHIRKRKWEAKIGVDNRYINLGYYAHKSDAMCAYILAKRLYHPFNPDVKPEIMANYAIALLDKMTWENDQRLAA